MKKTMGEIIRNLRKERNLTQEELAELLNVSGQAISKWENGTSMPDVSLIVPISKLFGVSTDVLFGVFGDDDQTIVQAIIDEAMTHKDEYSGYLILENGLKKYHCNIPLLVATLEHSIALAYPGNDCFDKEHSLDIYRKSERIANLIIHYAQNASDVFRARMIMITLHSIYGEPEKAVQHLQYFPCRADMTENNMAAQIAHSQGDFTHEIYHRAWEFLYLLEALIDNLTNSGIAYMELGQYNEAIQVLSNALHMIDELFAQETIIPPIHRRDCGDIYELLAKAYLFKNDTEQAVQCLEHLLEYNLKVAASCSCDWGVRHMPLIRPIPVYQYYYRANREEEIDKMVKLLERKPFCDWVDHPLMKNFRKKLVINI